MTITADSLARATRISAETAAFWAPLLDQACFLYDISTPARQAAFVAQCAHESAHFTRLVENLRYTKADRLMAVWPRLFPTPESAAPYVNDPMALASKVYAGVNGNGDEASLDGWTYRGRGLFQVTGRGNYRRVAKGLGEDFEKFPALLEHPELAANSAAWWWDDAKLNEYADGGAIDKISGVINRGDPNKPAIGKTERAWIFAQGLEAFA